MINAFKVKLIIFIFKCEHNFKYKFIDSYSSEQKKTCKKRHPVQKNEPRQFIIIF